MESELYGYPSGWALGHSDKWGAGVSIWHSEDRDRYMAGERPVFAVTDEWMEFQGYRWNPQKHETRFSTVEDRVSGLEEAQEILRAQVVALGGTPEA